MFFFLFFYCTNVYCRSVQHVETATAAAEAMAAAAGCQQLRLVFFFSFIFYYTTTNVFVDPFNTSKRQWQQQWRQQQ
jgi:hypothetical protein